MVNGIPMVLALPPQSETGHRLMDTGPFEDPRVTYDRAIHMWDLQPQVGRSLLPRSWFALAKTLSSISSVSFPVKVFCWDGW